MFDRETFLACVVYQWVEDNDNIKYGHIKVTPDLIFHRFSNVMSHGEVQTIYEWLKEIGVI